MTTKQHPSPLALAEQLAAGDRQGLETLLQLWRQERSLALGDLVERCASDPETFWWTVESPTSSKELTAAVKALENVDADPRAASALVAIVEAPPYTSGSMKPMWRSLFAQLVDHHWDPRSTPRLDAIDLSKTFGATNMSGWVAKELDKARAALAGRGFGEVYQERKIAALVAQHAPKPAPVVDEDDVSATEGRLLDAIATDLSNDAARLVYADWLEEQGQSARSEFINLQVRRTASGEAASDRERKLMKKAKTFLEPITGVLKKDSWHFDRGLLDRCKIYPRKAKVGELMGHPLWGTVTEVTLSETGDPAPIITHPVMRNLRSVHFWTYPRGLAGLLDSDAPVEELHHLYVPNIVRTPDVWRALVACERLPDLRLVALNGAQVEDIELLCAGGLARPGMQLFFASAGYRLPPLVQLLCRLPEADPQVTLTTISCEVHRDGRTIICTPSQEAIDRALLDVALAVGVQGTHEGGLAGIDADAVEVRLPESLPETLPRMGRFETAEALLEAVDAACTSAGLSCTFLRGDFATRYVDAHRVQL